MPSSQMAHSQEQKCQLKRYKNQFCVRNHTRCPIHAPCSTAGVFDPDGWPSCSSWVEAVQEHLHNDTAEPVSLLPEQSWIRSQFIRTKRFHQEKGKQITRRYAQIFDTFRLDGETLITLEIQFSGFEADNSSTQQIGSRVRRKSPSGEQQVPPPERPHSEAIVEQNSQIPQDMLNAGSNCQRFGSEANME